MKRIIAIVAAITLFAGQAMAQSYINFGYGQPTDIVSFGDMDPDTDQFNTIYAGFSRNFELGNVLGLEAGLNFIYGFKNTEEFGATLSYNSTGLNAPILFNYAIPIGNYLKIKALAGPTLHYGLASKLNSIVDGKTLYTVDYYEDGTYNKFFASAGVALAAEFFDVVRFKVGYDLGLTDLSPKDNISTKENLISFTLGFIF